jgi:hypothetical protein
MIGKKLDSSYTAKPGASRTASVRPSSQTQTDVVLIESVGLGKTRYRSIWVTPPVPEWTLGTL